MTTTTYASIVGIDPSLTGAAVALLPRRTSEEFGTPRLRRVETRAAPTKKGEPKLVESWQSRQARIDYVAREVMYLVVPESLVFIEAPAYSSNQGSAFDRYRLWESIVFRCRYLRCTIVPVSPQHRAMWATGSGNASKDDVKRAMVAKFPDLDLTYRGKVDDNICDALSMAALGAEVVGYPVAPLIGHGARQAAAGVHLTMGADSLDPIGWQYRDEDGKWTTPTP